MYQQPELLLEEYELTVKEIRKGRGAFLVTGEQGFYRLEEFHGSRERAELLGKLWESLAASGYAAEQLVRNREQLPLVEDEYGVTYMLKTDVRGTECNAKSAEELVEAMKELAYFHQCSEACVAELNWGWQVKSGELMEQTKRHTRELVKVKNYVRNQNRRNQFEELFQAQVGYYLELAQDNLTKLEAEKPEGLRALICHGDFNQHNVLRTEKGLRIVQLVNLQYNYATKDIAYFMRKMLEKNNYRSELGAMLLQGYQQVRPLNGAELYRIYLELSFPEKFWKVANHYYNSHKAWISGRDIEKLQRVIEQEQERVQFLENFFSFL